MDTIHLRYELLNTIYYVKRTFPLLFVRDFKEDAKVEVKFVLRIDSAYNKVKTLWCKFNNWIVQILHISNFSEHEVHIYWFVFI